MKDELLEKLNEVISNTIADSFSTEKLFLLLAEEKIKPLGISLTATQREEISYRFKKEDIESIHIQPTNDQKIHLSSLGLEDIYLEFNEEDINKLGTKITDVVKDISKNMFNEVLNSSSTKLVQQWKKQSNSILRKLRSDRKRFNKYNNKVWGKALDQLEGLVDISLDAGMVFVNKFSQEATEENDIVFEVLAKLHARSCQVSSEILTLLRNGFADGAHARWRTLHEISVIALFISQHDNELAERYLLHSTIADYLRAVEYKKYSELISYAPIPDEAFNQLKSNYDALLDKYEENFKKEYGWASVVLNNKKPNFTNIEDKTGILHMRPFVKLAHINIHAGSAGVVFRLGTPPDNPNLMIAGSSVFGIGEPAQNTAYSLEIVTESLLLRKPIIENVGFVLAFRNLMQDVIWEFDKTMEKQEKENKK